MGINSYLAYEILHGSEHKFKMGADDKQKFKMGIDRGFWGYRRDTDGVTVHTENKLKRKIACIHSICEKAISKHFISVIEIGNRSLYGDFSIICKNQ